MKKILKIMMMAFIGTLMAIGFAACSSDDDGDIYYQKGVTSTHISGSTLTPKAWSQIEDAYNATLGKADSFVGKSDADVKAKAEQAEKNISSLDWEGATGSITYSVKNINNGKTIYSKTFLSDSGSK